MASRPKRASAESGAVMTVDQVAAYLQLNRLTVYRYVREGKIPAAKLGKVYRILKADVDRFLESQKTTNVAGGQSSAESPRARVRSVWVGEGKSAEEIFVGPSRRERAQDRDPVILRSDPLAVIMRSLN
jgi:excisionase family DNA binding protein